MNEFILSELDFFLTSFFWGVILFLAYDFFVILRKVIHHAGFFVALEDIGFWITAGILIFHMMYELNNGIIRYYAIISIILGMKLYQLLFGKLIVRIGCSIGLWIKKQIRRFLHFLATPVRYIGRKIKKGLHFIGTIVKKRLTIIRKLVIIQVKKHVDTHRSKKREKELVKHEKVQEPIKVRGVLELVKVSANEGDEYEEKKKRRA